MAKNDRVRFKGGGYIDMSLVFDEIPDAFKAAIIANLSPVMDKMVAMAKQKVHVGAVKRASYTRKVANGKLVPTTPLSWTSRDPGRLRDTIRRAVHRRKDKTAIIGFFEAGSHDAYYALMHEYKSPYFEPAFNTYRDEGVAAIHAALEEVTK